MPTNDELSGLDLVAAVAREVCGWLNVDDDPPTLPAFFVSKGHLVVVHGDNETRGSRNWNPLTSMSDAWEIVDAMAAKGYGIKLEQYVGGAYGCEFNTYGRCGNRWGGSNPGEAICRAALAAKAVEKGGGE